MKKPIYLIDLTHESVLGPGSDTMPLQLGLIAAYCLKDHGDRVEVEIFKYIRDFEAAVERRPPFLVAASNYLWNIDLGYKAVQAVRRCHPEVISVFGGPNYPDERADQIDFLRAHPDIDFYIEKDGEVPFARLVGLLLDNLGDVAAAKKAMLPSVQALHEGEAQIGPLEPRLRDLTMIPSPYTTGLMDKFFDGRLLPTIQTNRGCPFSCTFCTEGSRYYTKVFKTSFDRKKAEIDYIVARVGDIKTLRITDSNFGMFEEDVEFCRYLGKIQDDTGYPEYVTCSAGKNKKERILECNRLLKGAMRLTASVQSLSRDVLEKVKRSNVSPDALMMMSDQTSDTDTHSYSEIILALPGDSLQVEHETIAGLMAAGIGNITQHQLALIYGTEINTRASREQYRMRGMYRPIQRCVGRYSLFGEEIEAIEIEEICVATDTLSYEDYIEARRLYLTVGIFYNDRIFGEIHALLRVLKLPTYEWIKLLHGHAGDFPPQIKRLYDEFLADTLGELWDTPERLRRDVTADLERYVGGEAGGNIIYKYRSRAAIHDFEALHATAYRYLRQYLREKGVSCEDAVRDIESYSRCQKFDLLNTDYSSDETYGYDVHRLITDPAFVRQGHGLEELRRPTRVRIQHTRKQNTMIRRELDRYGRHLGGLTMLLSRFPVKRFYRRAEVVEAPEARPPLFAGRSVTATAAVSP
ncbi:MAG: radical SAM protein [Dongiaceae bacterium]